MFGGKVAPVYQGMVISSAEDSTGNSDAATVKTTSYHGDYKGKNDDPDVNDPYGTGGTGLQTEVNSTLQIVETEGLYYADVNEDIYITINFYNPQRI